MKLVIAFVLAFASVNAVPKLDGRIVGGEAVEIEDYPYQLSLLYFGGHICGASIISEKWAVTAAHCTDGTPANYLSVRAGATMVGKGGQVSAVAAIHQHPKYNPSTVDYDISLLELERPLKFGAGVQPIPLPEKDEEVKTGEPAICSGWGALKEGGNGPLQLQAVTIKIVSHKECQEAYYNEDITPRMICAGVGGGKDACQGDSGGPLAVGGKLGGVVSWGYGCARPSHPGIYSNVANLRDYITEVAGI